MRVAAIISFILWAQFAAGQDAIFATNYADIASSAYNYRADRKPESNKPESWFALMTYSGQPLNKPVNLKDSAIRKVLNGLLWEEIRPVRMIQLTWKNSTKGQPKPEEILITTLDKKNKASSWWNNLIPVKREIKPVPTKDKKTYVYKIDSTINIDGLVISISNGSADKFDIPEVSVFTDSRWKSMNVEVEWAFDTEGKGKDYSGNIETYDGIISGLKPADAGTRIKTSKSWSSAAYNKSGRGIKFRLDYIGVANKRKIQPYTTQPDDVARSIVTLWTKAGNFSFLAADLENGPIYIPEYGVYIHNAAQPTDATAFVKQLKEKQLTTVRQKIRDHKEQTWTNAIEGIKHMKSDTLPAFPVAPPEYKSPMSVSVPDENLTAQWNLGAWHLLRHCKKNADSTRLLFNDFPYGILAAETYIMLNALDVMGMHKEAADGLYQWLSLPMQPMITDSQRAGDKLGQWKKDKHMGGTFSDRPTGNFSDGYGCFTLAEGVPGVGGHLDGVHAYGPGCIGWAINEHYLLTRDNQWLDANVNRIKGNVEWMLRQRKFLETMVPGGERLWGKGLQPAHEATPDSQGLFMQWYWSESFYYATVARFVELLKEKDPVEASRIKAEALKYKADIKAAVERSMALSPVVETLDGTYHTVIPFACYMRGLGTGAWAWQRDGSDGHWGALTFETDLSSSPLVTVADIFPIDDKRIQGYLDVLEDRLLYKNPRTDSLHWFYTGWQHQVGIQKTIDAHLSGDDIPVFIRSFLNSYAIHIVTQKGYVFNEHVFAGPPDKIFEDGAFIVRFRNMLLMEENNSLWITKGTPREWMDQGKKITIKNAPTYFGRINYEIISDVDNGRINATIETEKSVENIILRIRHPKAAPIKKVLIDGKEWKTFDASKEAISLKNIKGVVKVECLY